MSTQLWSWLLGLVGVAGFVLAGRKIWWAWYINIACQFLWFTYAIVTQQWGFFVSAVVYTVVFSQNAIQWTKDHYSPSRRMEEAFAQGFAFPRPHCQFHPDRTDDLMEITNRHTGERYHLCQPCGALFLSLSGNDISQPKRELMERCWYEKRWSDEVGDIWVCVVHENNSKYPVESTISHYPCLTLDPYTEEDIANQERRS